MLRETRPCCLSLEVFCVVKASIVKLTISFNSSTVEIIYHLKAMAILHSSVVRLCHADEANKAETADHGCHCPGDMAVRMREVLANITAELYSVTIGFR